MVTKDQTTSKNDETSTTKKAMTELAVIGKQITSLADKIAREEKAAVDTWNKHVGESTTFRVTLAEKLKEAEPVCKAAGMTIKELREKYIGDRISNTQFKQILSVARGRITFQEIKAAETARKQKTRAAKAGTAPVPSYHQPADTEEYTEARKALNGVNAALADVTEVYGLPAALAVLAAHGDGVTNTADLKPDQYEAVIRAANEYKPDEQPPDFKEAAEAASPPLAPEMASGETDTPPTTTGPLHTTADDLSQEALVALKNLLWKVGLDLNAADYKQYREFVNHKLFIKDEPKGARLKWTGATVTTVGESKKTTDAATAEQHAGAAS